MQITLDQLLLIMINFAVVLTSFFNYKLIYTALCVASCVVFPKFNLILIVNTKQGRVPLGLGISVLTKFTLLGLDAN
jgi:hypothetical protein